jgi:hypothetical protein
MNKAARKRGAFDVSCVFHFLGKVANGKDVTFSNPAVPRTGRQPCVQCSKTQKTPNVPTIKQFLFGPENSQMQVDFLHANTQKHCRHVDVLDPDKPTHVGFPSNLC